MKIILRNVRPFWQSKINIVIGNGRNSIEDKKEIGTLLNKLKNIKI